MVRTSPPRVVSSALARSSSSASRARSATFPPSLEICRAKIRPSPREPPLIKTTFPENEKRLRHARVPSHAPRIVIAIAVPRLIKSNSHLPASPDDKLCRSVSDDSTTRHTALKSAKILTRALTAGASFLFGGRDYHARTHTHRENQKKKGNDMKLDTLQKLYVDELRDLYNAENQLLKALPKMAKAASSEELKNAFEKHLGQTETHVERLEEIFQELDHNPKGKTCRGMKGLIEEGSEILGEEGDSSVLDAGIIVAAQKVEHYEIAGYGSVRTF